MTKKYRVLVDGLTYPTDVRILRRLAAGEALTLSERKMCPPHVVGDIVDDVPKTSIPGLLRKAWIEEVFE